MYGPNQLGVNLSQNYHFIHDVCYFYLSIRYPILNSQILALYQRPSLFDLDRFTYIPIRELIFHLTGLNDLIRFGELPHQLCNIVEKFVRKGF